MQNLKPGQEDELAKWIKQLEACCRPPRVSQVTFMVSELYARNRPQALLPWNGKELGMIPTLQKWLPS